MCLIKKKIVCLRSIQQRAKCTRYIIVFFFFFLFCVSYNLFTLDIEPSFHLFLAYLLVDYIFLFCSIDISIWEHIESQFKIHLCISHTNSLTHTYTFKHKRRLDGWLAGKRAEREIESSTFLSTFIANGSLYLCVYSHTTSQNIICYELQAYVPSSVLQTGRKECSAVSRA